MAHEVLYAVTRQNTNNQRPTVHERLVDGRACLLDAYTQHHNRRYSSDTCYNNFRGVL